MNVAGQNTQSDSVEMEYKFKRFRTDKYSEERLLSEMEDVAKKLNYREFTIREFNEIANISAGPIKRLLGWKNALEKLKLRLKKRKITLKPNYRADTISEKSLFKELERIWGELGHRPSKNEWNDSNPNYSYSTYRRKFGGWKSACLKFIEFKLGKFEIFDLGNPEEKHTRKKKKLPKSSEHRNRDVPSSLKVKVFKRDFYSCRSCGNSPAIERGVVLEVDHKYPFSKRGKTILSNLVTLCRKCNRGKSNNIF